MILTLFKKREEAKTCLPAGRVNRNLTSKLILLTIFTFLLFFSLTLTTEAATESTAIIRENCALKSIPTANCYTSLSLWEAGEQRDLTATDQIAIVQIEGPWTNPDTTPVVISGWTTDATRYIKIFTTTEARHTGVWSTGKYRLSINGGSPLTVSSDHVRVDGLQFEDTGSVASHSLIRWNNTGFTLSNSVIRKSIFDIKVNIALYTATPNINAYFYNNIIYDLAQGILDDSPTPGSFIYWYNNTVYNGVTCINSHPSATRFLAKNSITQNCTNGWNGLFDANSNYNISDLAIDAPGANSKNLTTVTFLNPASGDFHLSTSDTSARDAGTNLSADPILAFSTDIDAETRSGVWDIGADEYVYIPPPDITPPVRSGSSPSGVFSSGTASVTLSLVTDEDATCKYSTVFSTDYASTQFTFTTTGSTSHIASVAVSSSQSYTYYVRCRDATGNANVDAYAISFSVSSPSPADATPPSSPTGLTVTAISPSRIVLSWEASRDVNGVIGYYIYRNGIHITTTPETTYTDINLTPSISYTYTVSAYDTAGNFSPQGTKMSVDTKALIEVVAPPPPPTSPVIIRPSYHFSNDHLITYGMNNNADIQELQKVLQYEGLLPNTSFALDGVFLEATKNAVIKFQEKHGLTPRDGKVGPVTKKKLNELYGSTPVGTSTEITHILRNLTIGSRGEDVKKLQRILNADIATRITATGVGSLGNESTYFGTATKASVIKYQKKNNISPADGYVGPVTRGKLEGR